MVKALLELNRSVLWGTGPRALYFKASLTLSRPFIPALRTISSKTSATPTNDEVLRKVFDDPKYFREFNSHKHSVKSPFSSFRALAAPKSGLFLNEYLTNPLGLVQFSVDSLATAKKLSAELVAPNLTEADKLQFVKKIDQLSDILCRVIDVAEFIRVAHPSNKWVSAAQQTHELMFEFMNQLNTNVKLYRNLVDVLNDPKIARKLTDEEMKVGDYLVKDFERSGIDLDDTIRGNFVNITQEISLIGLEFNNGTQMLKDYWCPVLKEEFELIPKTIRSQINKYVLKSGRLDKLTDFYVPLAGEIPYDILSVCSNKSLRKKVWILLHSSTKELLELLNAFLKYRAFLAMMLGYKSFSSYQLEHKMAKNPENVLSFLGNLQGSLIRGGVLNELTKLHQQKLASTDAADSKQTNVITDIKPWDRDYLLNGLKQASIESNATTSAQISEYLSVGTIVSGLSQLFSLIYGISLVPEATECGETWDHQVRKLAVCDVEANKTFGYIYVDFWSGKVLPSHFTIVCLRQLNENEDAEAMTKQTQIAVNASKDGGYQLPVISLVCNFGNSNSAFAGTKPTLLSLDQVDTVFHEMGHAMHSMIGRTNLHNLAGTRCLTDFVELPSVLMEFFSKDKRVLTKIAKHYQTNEPLPEEMFEQCQSQRNTLEDCETYIQSKMAMLDQVLHSEAMVSYVSSGRSIDSTEIYHNLESQLKVFADTWTTWHAKFPHLFSYGAVYYSYLLDRAIAEKIWIGLFEQDPWSRSAGEKYKESVLKWGGTRDPWECLADALGDEELRNGDERAMEIIGSKAQ